MEDLLKSLWGVLGDFQKLPPASQKLPLCRGRQMQHIFRQLFLRWHVPPNFPQKISLPKIKKNSPTSFCRSARRNFLEACFRTPRNFSEVAPEAAYGSPLCLSSHCDIADHLQITGVIWTALPEVRKKSRKGFLGPLALGDPESQKSGKN